MGPSPSSRRAWIEILFCFYITPFRPVALLAEGVDRNAVVKQYEPTLLTVALLAEGVDRNMEDLAAVKGKSVALLAEGVDRNLIGLDVVLDPANVALLAEGVDRNFLKAMSR